jgi:hypothetical protein
MKISIVGAELPLTPAAGPGLTNSVAIVTQCYTKLKALTSWANRTNKPGNSLLFRGAI